MTATLTYTVLLPDGTAEEHTAVCLQGIRDQEAHRRALAAVARILNDNGAIREGVVAIGGAAHDPAKRPLSQPAGRPDSRPAAPPSAAGRERPSVPRPAFSSGK
jgi:hypothetical protein